MSIAIELNGAPARIRSAPFTRLSEVLRTEFGLTGTKVGCDAGDCGACSVLLDGEPVCACLCAAAQLEGRRVDTVEGLASGVDPVANRVRQAFIRHGAAQCGFCTPGMLVAATALLRREADPDEAAALDAIGGVLCRCTGYRKIVAAILDARDPAPSPASPASGAAIGARIDRVDAQRKLDGSELFGDDTAPADALLLRVVRSPHHRAAFAFGDLETFRARHPELVVLTARDVPGLNRYGVIPSFADQPVFAEREVRFRGEAVAAIVGPPDVVAALDLGAVPVAWTELPALTEIDDALAEGAERIHPERAGNVLVRGRVVRGDVERALGQADVTVTIETESGFVEHAPIEPEAGWARRVGDRIEVHACTQAPYMDRDDVALILGLDPHAVRIVPTAVGGGFGTKLDLSVQPFLAVAAWRIGRPVRMTYSRPESIATTTKRHPSRIRMTAGARADGRLLALDVEADFNTGAYASWGPTVANRVPVHASGPYLVPHYRALSRAVHTHLVPAGAFRGFGVPQAAVAQEQLYDELALRLGLDPLAFRIDNALGPDDPTVTGQVLGPGTGIRACLEALVPHWERARAEAERSNAGRGVDPSPAGEGSAARHLRRGVGVAGMWYGCGNTSMSNPSTMRIGLTHQGRIAIHQGAVDIGQGSNTVMTQIAADALGLPVDAIDLLPADTDISPDCGKTSASRQTVISGKATELAGRALRAAILRLANAGGDSSLSLAPGEIHVLDGDRRAVVRLAEIEPDRRGYALSAEETFDPPTTPLDADGQGDPYGVYGFGAHLAEVEIDLILGTVRVLKITAAHDVGRAINPTLLEGQVEGGVAQGLGLALMEEFHPGRGENLHDYLIPTVGDVPPIETILIEDPSPVGPSGAKGIGEQALIPTAPAILNAIRDATGVRITRVPATPSRVLAALKVHAASLLPQEETGTVRP